MPAHFHIKLPILLIRITSVSLLQLMVFATLPFSRAILFLSPEMQPDDFSNYDVVHYLAIIIIDTLLYLIAAILLDTYFVDRKLKGLQFKTEDAQWKEDSETLDRFKSVAEYELSDWIERPSDEVKEKGVAVKIRQLTKKLPGRGRTELKLSVLCCGASCGASVAEIKIMCR